MPTINDYKKKALKNAGYTGDITTAEYKWLRAICAPYKGTITDMWRYALKQAGYTGPLPNAQNKMLATLGYTTGSISNKWYKYWRDRPLEGVGGIAGLGSAIALWFDVNQAYKSSGGGIVTPSSLLTVARASAGSYFDSAGVLKQAANNALRLDYNPITLAPLGVLIEEIRTNLMLQSEQFENAAYTQSGATVTANQIVAPDGATTADLITAGAINANRVQQLFTIPITTVITLSCFFKAGTANAAISYSNAGGANVGYGKFTLSGAGSAVINGGATSATITQLPNSWYRCTLTLTTGIANGAAAFGPWDGTTDQFNYPGSNSTTVYAWGAQVELGSFATSYIPTVASTATRQADIISILTSAFPYNATEGTLVCEGSTMTGGATPHFASISNGGISNRFLFRADNVAQFYCISGGGVVAQLDNGTITLNTTTKLAAAFKQDDFASSLSGAAPATDSAGAMPIGITTLYLGTRGDGDGTDGVLNGYLRRLAYYPSRKTNAELQTLSA